MEHHNGKQDRYVLAQALWNFVLPSTNSFTFFEPSRELDDTRRTEEPRNDLYPTFERSDHTPESVLGEIYQFRPLVCSQQNTVSSIEGNYTGCEPILMSAMSQETRISANRLPTVVSTVLYDTPV